MAFAARALMGGSRSFMGGGGEKKAEAAEVAKQEAKKIAPRDWFQPDSSSPRGEPTPTHTQKDTLRAIVGDNKNSLLGKNNDRFSPRRQETDDRSSPQERETGDRSSTRRRGSGDQFSPRRQETGDRSSTRRRETDDGSNREKTASSASSVSNGDIGDKPRNKLTESDHVHDENANVDGKQEADAKQQPESEESKNTRTQRLTKRALDYTRDNIKYNGIQSVDNNMDNTTSKIGGTVEKILGGSGGGSDSGSNGTSLSPLGMRGDRNSGDKNSSKPSDSPRKTEGVKPKLPETKPKISKETRDILKGQLDRFLESHQGNNSLRSDKDFRSKLNRGSERTYRRSLEESGVPVESVA